MSIKLKKYCILLLQFVFFNTEIIGQGQIAPIRISSTTNDIYIGKYLYVAGTKLNRHDRNLLSFSYLKQCKTLKFWIQNVNIKDTLNMCLLTSKQNRLRLYETAIDSGSNLKILTHEIKPQKLIAESFGYEITIPPKKLYGYTLNHEGNIYPEDFTPVLTDRLQLIHSQNDQFVKTNWLLSFLFLIIGVATFLFIAGLLMFVNSQSLIYLWGGGYSAANALFLLLNVDYYFNFPSFSVTGLIVPTQHVVFAFYTLFISIFFQFKSQNIFLYRLSIALVLTALGLMLLSTVLIYTDISSWLNMFDNQTFVVLEGCLVSLLLYGSTLNIPQKTYVVIGSFGMIVMSVVASLLDIYGQTDIQFFWRTPIAIYGLGILFDLFCLAVALSQRLQNEIEQKNEFENTIIRERLQFDVQLAETEMTALRAQMNPHFIFNCLNSIKLYTLENDSLKATEYMTKFSRLIRLVLENSRSERITLANELETLELYIEMEAMRFKNKVAYQINLADNIDTHYIEIPPLLIQPYVENAI
jgi:sensor histidine kinase YesM